MMYATYSQVPQFFMEREKERNTDKANELICEQ